MAESSPIWNILLIAPRAIHGAPDSDHESSLFREGHHSGKSAMHRIAETSFEGLIDSLLAIGPPMEKLSFSRICGILNNQEELAAHAGRVCFVRRVNKDLLQELNELWEGKHSQARIQVLGWAPEDNDFVSVPLDELFDSQKSAT